jgi:hypothetical protein
MTKDNNKTGAAMVDAINRKHPSYAKRVNYEAPSNGKRPAMTTSKKQTIQDDAVYTQG